VTDKTISGASFSTRGIMLLGYQRTRHISAAARDAWEAGDPSVLQAEAEARREAIFQAVLDEVASDYAPIRTALAALEKRPASVIDIGCGQALNDALLVQDFAPRLTLVDIEETFAQYHSWNAHGSGYASLAEAEAFLRENGATDVRVINPRHDSEAIETLEADLVTSLLSCGFHYPVGEYLDLLLRTISAGGAVILDIRRRYLAAPDAALEALLSASQQIALETSEPKAHRLMFTA